jgi:nucleoside-diphosphate-sugar epimerase
MARIFITDSADGLGRAAAQTLLGDGHEVIVHARSAERLAAVKDLIGRGAAAVVGDLADLDQTRAMAEQVNELGGVDAVIHNAGVLSGPQVMPVNIVAPYLLTAVINRPQRLIYLSSDMHHGGRAEVAGLDVIVREVVDTADRWQAAEGGVGAVHVVPVNPGLQGTLAGGV